MFEEFIKRHIERIIEEFDYDNMKSNNPDYCPCLKSGQPCINVEDLNCFFCYCPEYDRDKKEGGCKINNTREKGKWHYHPDLTKGKIWDCSDCSYPHERETIRNYLKKLFNLEIEVNR